MECGGTMDDENERSFSMEDALRLKDLLEGKGRAPTREKPPRQPVETRPEKLTRSSSVDDEDLGSWKPFDVGNLKQRPSSSGSASTAGRKGSAPVISAAPIATGVRRGSEEPTASASWLGKKIGRRASEHVSGTAESVSAEVEQNDIAWARTQPVGFVCHPTHPICDF